MCHQVTYTLPCEHVKTQTIYCADATLVTSGSSTGGISSKNGSSPSSKHKAKSVSGSASSSSKHKSHGHHSKTSSSTSGSTEKTRKRACAKMTIQSLPYPTPPSYAADPAAFSSSPLSPRCPLVADCPFEQKNRCWNCCWCGKGWNQTGRCSCVMLIDGNQVCCEHICCPQCEPAVGGGNWESAGGYS